MGKIEKIFCPILNEIKKNSYSGTVMGRPEVFIYFDEEFNPKQILGCPNYKDGACEERTKKSCLYSEGFKPLNKG